MRPVSYTHLQLREDVALFYDHHAVVRAVGTGCFELMQLHHSMDYGVVIVKQGYIFPELKELGALCVRCV